LKKRVLIVRFSSIGDIVLTTPVVRCVKKQLPGAEVHFLTKKQFLPVLEANPYIDKLWGFDHNFKELIPQLKFQGFDFIADLHGNYRSGFVKSQLRLPAASFPKLNVQKWLMVNLKINLLPEIHIVDRYFQAVRSLGVKNDGQGLDYFIPAEAETDPGTFPEAFHHGYVAVVIGGKHNTKIFPEEKVTEVCRKLGRPVILLGGPEDRERGDRIAEAAGSKVLNKCGALTLNQSASVVRQATSVLTNDTGLMHIAAAFRKPVVSVWGNTIPAFGMYPYLPEEQQKTSWMAEVRPLKCRPCSKLGYSRCPKKHFRCMTEIDTDEIAGRL
jgi:ADP-heptose:LPS heptosyltransferase